MSRIAIFDYRVIRTNPIGSCHLKLLQALCDEHDFTVFAAEFDNPRPDRIRWVRVPVPMRPLALLFVSYHLLAPLLLLAHRLRGGSRFDLIQVVESNLGFGDVAYVHFCHRAYLERHWRTSRPTGLRGFLRWLDHRLHAVVEPLTYSRARCVVAPSPGLIAELGTFYPATSGKTRVIPNPIDVEALRRPPNFDAQSIRKSLGLGATECLVLFSALGQFERKGLPLVLEALRELRNPALKLLVVGGEADLVSAYRAHARRAGLEQQVTFVGLQRDVKPFLWAADVVVFPSAYEAFSLVVFEAAAAGVVLIATPVNGVREFLRDGDNGIVVERTVHGVMDGIRRFAELSPVERKRIAARAQADVQAFGPTRFSSAWRHLYSELTRDNGAQVACIR